jgi:serine/threonine protein phosphatase PrpC
MMFYKTHKSKNMELTSESIDRRTTVSTLLWNGGERYQQDILRVMRLLSGEILVLVVDGHGNDGNSNTAAEYIVEHFQAILERVSAPSSSSSDRLVDIENRSAEHRLASTLATLRSQFQSLAEAKRDTTGCVFAAALVNPQSQRVHVMNLGDCRAIFCKEVSPTFFFGLVASNYQTIDQDATLHLDNPLAIVRNLGPGTKPMVIDKEMLGDFLSVGAVFGDHNKPTGKIANCVLPTFAHWHSPGVVFIATDGFYDVVDTYTRAKHHYLKSAISAVEKVKQFSADNLEAVEMLLETTTRTFRVTGPWDNCAIVMVHIQ